MKAKYICAFSALALLGAAARDARAIDRNVNQIDGTLSFTNTLYPSLIEPTYGASVSGRSLGAGPTLTASTTPTQVSPVLFSYSLSVQTGAPPAGLAHVVAPFVSLDNGRDSYQFQEQTSAPVFPETDGTSPNVQLNFAECAGFVRIRWVNANGLVPVDSFNAHAYPEQTPGLQDFGGRQAYTSGGTSAGSEVFAVRADGRAHRIDIGYTVGTDPYSNTMRDEFHAVVNVACDQEVIVDIPMGDVGGGLPAGLGRIDGILDLLYESEIANTTMYGWGPLANDRYALIGGTPASGAFSLINLVPSTRVTPNVDWNVRGYLSFLNVDSQLQDLHTPYVSRHVAAGATVNLGNTFVMNPGYMRGGVLLDGVHACRQAFSGPEARLQAWGRGAAGGGYAGGGITTASGPSSVLFPSETAITGKQALAVATPGNVAAQWDPRFRSVFRDPNASNVYTDITVHDVLLGAPVVGPTNTPANPVNVPERLCFGEYVVRYDVNTGVPSGTQFHSPIAYLSGALNRRDAFGLPADYAVGATAYGAPPRGSLVSSSAIHVCAPAGDYTVRPAIHAVAATGEESYTELVDAPLAVPCGGRIDPFEIAVSRISCGSSGLIPFSISTHGVPAPAQASRVEYEVYQVTPTPSYPTRITSGIVCDNAGATACPSGMDPTLTFDLQSSLIAPFGRYAIVVKILSAASTESISGQFVFGHETSAPAGNPCTAAAVTIGSPADLTAAIAGLNRGGYDVSQITCRDTGTAGGPAIPVVGNVFSKSTTVQCRMTTDCFTNRTCSFKVNASP